MDVNGMNSHNDFKMRFMHMAAIFLFFLPLVLSMRTTNGIDHIPAGGMEPKVNEKTGADEPKLPDKTNLMTNLTNMKGEKQPDHSHELQPQVEEITEKLKNLHLSPNQHQTAGVENMRQNNRRQFHHNDVKIEQLKKEYQQRLEKEWDQRQTPHLNDPFFPPGIFDRISPDANGSYLNSVPDPIIRGVHIWELTVDGDKYHQLPNNGDIYMQDAKGNNWKIVNGQMVPHYGPLPPVPQTPVNPANVPAKPSHEYICPNGIFDNVNPNKEGGFVKRTEEGYVYEFKDGIAYCLEPNGALFFKNLMNGETFYQTPGGKHLFKYLADGKAELVVPEGKHHGSSEPARNDKQSIGKRHRGVRIMEVNDDGTPKDSSAAHEKDESSSSVETDEPTVLLNEEKTYHDKEYQSIKKHKINEKATKIENFIDSRNNEKRHERTITHNKIHLKYRKDGTLEKAKYIEKEKKAIVIAHPTDEQRNCRENSTCVTTTRQRFNPKGEITSEKTQLTKSIDIIHSEDDKETQHG